MGASNYGLNFGFRRSDGLQIEGKFKVPVAGTFRQGSLVMIDSASAGYVKAATAGAVGKGGYVGLLVQEDAWDRNIYVSPDIDSFSMGAVINDRLTGVAFGAGNKVWLKNTASSTRADGRVISAVTMVDLTTGTPTVGSFLTWDGTKFAKGTAESDSMLRITEISGTTYCEAVLLG